MLDRPSISTTTKINEQLHKTWLCDLQALCQCVNLSTLPPAHDLLTPQAHPVPFPPGQ